MMKERLDKVVRNIKVVAAQNGESNSVAKISERVHIPATTLSDKMKHPERLTMVDLLKIAEGLNVDLEKIIE
ncbi:MAG: helix-turn-helix domain-containing protein [Lachnospiraceae bacterium]|nr:helix-turn-helix domain-containing protein [Ruminococcus sp.]MCM1275797.1 helix-turn-helix domain-containing protein [Lachnospiraceae bacterium]